MKTIRLAWKYIKQNPATSLLGILLAAFGTAILCLLLLTSRQLENQLDKNSRGIDLVVGAKGSPTQLILSSVYHVDNPTGNISFDDAKVLAKHPMIASAVPIALGDNYKGHRIVGTDSTFLALYDLKLQQGKPWSEDFDAVIGAAVAREKGLKLGDNFVGAHGLSDGGHVHDDHPYVVTGILAETGKLVDGLILTSIRSVWAVHGIETSHTPDDTLNREKGSVELISEVTEGEGEEGKGEVEEGEVLVKSRFASEMVSTNKSNEEITALLIQYRTPSAIAVLPRHINQQTTMQAASPAIESARLFSLLGVGIDSLQLLAYVIMGMAAFSVFISLYHSFRSRKFDLAVMRTLGASRTRLFGMVIVEGMIITGIGTLIGLFLGHLAMYYIGAKAGQAGSLVNAFKLIPGEGWLIVVGIGIGFISAIIPAIRAYNTPISRTLAERNN